MKVKFWTQYQKQPVVAIIEKDNALEFVKGTFKWDKGVMKIGEIEVHPSQIRKIKHWQTKEDIVYCEQILFGMQELRKEKRSKEFFNMILEDSFI